MRLLSILHSRFTAALTILVYNLTKNDAIPDFSQITKLADNVFIEVFNGRLYGECLNARCFLALDDTR